MLDKQIWLGVWVLVCEIEVVVRKGMLEMPKKTMIPGMWVLEGVAAVVVGWWPEWLEAALDTLPQQGRLVPELVVVLRGHQFSQVMVGVGVVELGLIGALQALVGVVREVVAVGC